MNGDSLRRLILMEFERYWSFPVPEIVLAFAMLALWNRPYPVSYVGLWFNYVSVPTFLILVVGVTTIRSTAGSFGSREIIAFLSYPIKRGSIFAAKFIANFLIPFAIFGAVILLAVPLLGLNILNPAIHALILVLFLHTLFICSAATAISFAVKSETLSVFATVVLFFGFDLALGMSQPPFRYLNFSGSNQVISDYITNSSLSLRSQYTFQDFALATTFPLVASIAILLLSFIYFRWIMQFD